MVDFLLVHVLQLQEPTLYDGVCAIHTHMCVCMSASACACVRKILLVNMLDSMHVSINLPYYSFWGNEQYLVGIISAVYAYSFV